MKESKNAKQIYKAISVPLKDLGSSTFELSEKINDKIKASVIRSQSYDEILKKILK